MIPRIVHYCWFSGQPYPREVQHCLQSWQRHLPDFTLRLWDATSFPFHSVPFVQEAMAAGKYAFASDYVRLYALYTHGGVYLDSDVEVMRNFGPFLDNTFFCGTEAYDVQGAEHYRMEAAIMGAEAGHPFLRACMEHYEQAHYTAQAEVMPAVISRIAAAHGYRYLDEEQLLPNGVRVYPTTVFTNTLQRQPAARESLYALHHNAATWMDYAHRGALFHFCRRHGLMPLYRGLERLRRKS